MRTHRPKLLSAACLIGLLASVGCQPQARRQVDLGPQRDANGYPRSVALDAPPLNRLTQSQATGPGLPWYADRNDRTPAVAAGYRLPTVESSVTVTRDRQYHSNGGVQDQFDSTTYRREYREVVR